MKKKTLLILAATFVFFSCTKNELKPTQPPLAAMSVKPLDGAAAADINLMLTYDASSRTINAEADLNWYNGMPSDFSGYTLRFTISGTSPNTNTPITVDMPVTSSGTVLYSTSVTFTDVTKPATVTVKAELIYNFSTISSATNSATVSANINYSSEPLDSSATISLTYPYVGTSCTLTASNINYLATYPTKSVYFYAFFIPTLDERNNQHLQTQYLGSAIINGYSINPQGNIMFNLPNNELDFPNLRFFLSTKQFDESYFTRPLMNVGYETYFIDQCTDDGVYYDIYTRGLNSLDGRFSYWGYPSPNYSTSTTFFVNSMNQMLNTQIYILQSRGFLW